MNKRLIIIFLSFTIALSCEQGYITDCEYCYETKPEVVYLEIFGTFFRSQPVIYTITIYEGDIEENNIIDTFSSAQELFEMEAIPYKKYTVSAEYNYDGQEYIAIDSAFPQIRYDQSTCESPCYFVYGNVVDVRLRYRSR